MQQTADTLPTFEHFEIEQMAEGVYAAIGVAGGAAYSNAGIIDLGNHTLVFDTFMTPKAAEDLRAAAEHLTGRLATYVINSHADSDHWCGNQVFATHATIIATHKNREMMPAAIDYLKQFKEDPSMLEEQIRNSEERLRTETDARWRVSLELSIAKMHHVLESLPRLDFRLPHQTFEGKLVFHGMQRTAELFTAGSGHTDSDAYLVLPEERIVFMGDLGFFQCQPFMARSDPQAWRAQLEEMEQSNIEVFVPGHGPLGTKADIALQKEYITVLEELVAQVIKEGGSAEDAVQKPLPAPFDAWLRGEMARFEANVRSTYQRLSGERVT
jgi:glyoxylase-like metal-dependent hydrolase (beta-lactamase superfamily II)